SPSPQAVEDAAVLTPDELGDALYLAAWQAARSASWPDTSGAGPPGGPNAQPVPGQGDGEAISGTGLQPAAVPRRPGPFRPARLPLVADWAPGPVPADYWNVGRPLRDAPEILRGLRPLKRLADSRCGEDLDEDMTAERAAEDDLWLPYTRPAKERWLDLVLVVD